MSDFSNLSREKSHIFRHKYFSRGWLAWQEICNLQLLVFINGDYPATLPIPVWPRQYVRVQKVTCVFITTFTSMVH